MKEWVVIISFVSFVASHTPKYDKLHGYPKEQGWEWTDCYGSGNIYQSGWIKTEREYHVFKSSELAHVYEEGLYRGAQCDGVNVSINERDVKP